MVRESSVKIGCVYHVPAVFSSINGDTTAKIAYFETKETWDYPNVIRLRKMDLLVREVS